VGIIARVSGALAGYHVNIADITQTILPGNFVMMMMVDLSGADISIEKIRKALDFLGGELSLSKHGVPCALRTSV
jgi:ACT domain-containing protein